jgi:regulator of replication initiation timing
MIKQDVYEKELAKLNEIFKDIEEPKRQLVEGLIQDAAFLFAENHVLKDAIAQTGMIKIHPQHPDIQKPIETGKQYLRNINSYAVIIKTLNAVLSKNILDLDDDLSEFE